MSRERYFVVVVVIGKITGAVYDPSRNAGKSKLAERAIDESTPHRFSPRQHVLTKRFDGFLERGQRRDRPKFNLQFVTERLQYGLEPQTADEDLLRQYL